MALELRLIYAVFVVALGRLSITSHSSNVLP